MNDNERTAMNLHTVTITGADDSTKISDMVSISERFPFVEWGILVSASQAGVSRFPGKEWMDDLNRQVEAGRPMKLSMHLCGRPVRALLVGELSWKLMPVLLDKCQRVQVNTHGEQQRVDSLAMRRNLRELLGRQFIFQWDGLNNGLTKFARDEGVDAAGLFDTSAGAGILPDHWSAPPIGVPMGYAGGLGPDNVMANLEKIEALCPQPFWIDMERRVRTPDDSSLDLVAVTTVLEQAENRIAR